jgi:Protein of unknown function (DUF3311)
MPVLSNGSQNKRRGRNAWSYWLLLLVIPFTLWVPLYNRVEPTFIGFPFFYWYLLAWVIIGAVLTGAVYFLTEPKQGGSAS